MELVGDDPDYQEPFLTGYFRDGKRRIDMMLVTKDTTSEVLETMKMNFLMNAINLGLDIEIEAGSGKGHTDLNFIKVHAPDHILQHFGLYYNIKKFFKISHLEFVNCGVKDEKEMIQIMRRWYPSQMFSNFERSQIVYKVLLSVTFGLPENYIGINQLIDHNIILDVYPLHDGPYHLVPGQTALELNGRQALFYNWCGYKNLFRQIPLNLIREYLGERVGFFFAFYQFYNCFLLLLAVLGIFVFAFNYDVTGRDLQLNEHGMQNSYGVKVNRTYAVTETHATANGEIVTPTKLLTTSVSYGTTIYEYPDLPICPKCKNMIACPFRAMEAYRRELVCKVFLDNPLEYYMAFATIVWGILLYVLFIRKENYWYWLWETDEEDSKSLTRPEYRYLPKVNKLPTGAKPLIEKGERVMSSKKKDKMLPRGQHRPMIRNTVAFFILLVAIIVVCLLYPSLMIALGNSMLHKAHYIEMAGQKLYPGDPTYPEYIIQLDPKIGFRAIERFNHFVVVTIGSLNGIFIIVMEIVWYVIANKVIKIQKPRSEWQYERFHTSNLFGMTILINFIMVAFYAFIKGALYTYPDDDNTWPIPLQLGVMNCGLLYCVDEVFLVFVATFKTKLFYEQIMYTLTPLPTDKQRDPKEYDPPLVDRTACWEREFDLLPVTEDFVSKQYNKLLLQIAVVTFFIAVFPLTAIIAFLWNLWNIRYLAKLMVRHSRRPLLVQTWGLGAWREILFILPYIACLTNATFLVRNNSLLDRKFNNRYWSHQDKRRFFADYFMGYFNVSDYNWSRLAKQFYQKNFDWLDHVKFCMFPGQYNRMITGRKLYINMYTPMAGKWYVHWRQTLFVLAFSVLIIGIGILLNTMINPVSEKVQNTKRVEEAVKQYGIEEMPKSKFD